jgi:hypothetical protein
MMLLSIYKKDKKFGIAGIAQSMDVDVVLLAISASMR